MSGQSYECELSMTKSSTRAAEVAERRSRGMLLREIADELGLSLSYVSALANDPTGAEAKARKRSYRGICESCGGPTDGSRGPRNAPRLCRPCLRDEQSELTRARIVAEIRYWAELYGRPPAASDWNLACLRQRATVERIAECERRHREDGPWPPAATAQYVFGSWNAAIEAAGFEPLAPGGRR